jgi:hypothetical protein
VTEASSAASASPISRVRSVLALGGDHDAEGVREMLVAEGVEAAHTLLQRGLLVVDGNGDLDGRPHAVDPAPRPSEQRERRLSVPWEPRHLCTLVSLSKTSVQR